MTKKKEVETKAVMPKIKTLQFNHVLITADYEGSNGIILTPDNYKKERHAKDIQTVLMVGPHVLEIEPGDKVIIDTRKLSAKNASIVTVVYDKFTGEVVHIDNKKNIKEENWEFAFLITDREILYPLL